MRYGRFLVPLVLVFAGGAMAASEPSTLPATTPSIIRKPQWPLKDRRTFFTDEAIARARQNVAKYPSAKAVADSWIKLADEWIGRDDEKLVRLIPSASVPRAFDLSSKSRCPKCGETVGDPNAKVGWRIDPDKPFKLTCPRCKTVLPTNDFEAYYRSGYKQKIGWDTEFVDDGWGWTDPKTGEKYWFVAHANHWMLHSRLMNVMHALGRAYLITGDKRYAHKALVALHRFAEVYPEMDHASQSRYGQMMKAMGRTYPGKIVNHIWETDMVSSLTDAYDACWDTIDGDEALRHFTGKSGKEIRAFIEANLLEDAIDAYFAGKIRGNFGMHQGTLARLAIVRQHGEQEKWLDSLMFNAGDKPQMLGLDFALYNLIFRDGIPWESSIHYNSIWLERISQYAPLLEQSGRKPFEIPKLKRIYDAALALILAREHNTCVGDSGNVWGGIVRPDVGSFQTAYRHYPDARLAQYLARYKATGDGSFTTFESLFHPPIETPSAAATQSAKLAPQPSRLLDGYGMGILNNPEDSVAATLYYGLKAGHGHFDRLSIELFANGHPMMPDLGYPDAMNEFVPGIYTWSKNTIAHNTVTVDARRQSGNEAGTVELFANGRFARVMDISGKGTYPQCDQYRRALIQVDCGSDQSYFVDVFTVSGGEQHDYSLHGPPGTFETIGGTWSKPRPGTLAGENVTIGEIYDDPKLGAEDYKGGYSSYRGSGFQHLYNVRRHQGGSTTAQWSHEKDPDAKLRLYVLDQPDQQLILANARVSQVKHPQVLTYLIARRKGEKLSSRFVSVIEPFRVEPLIKEVAQLPIERGSGVAVELVRTDGGTDIVVYDPQCSEKSIPRINLRTTSHVMVIRRDAEGKVRQRFSAGGPSFVTVNGQRTHLPTPGGDVISVNPEKSQIRVTPKPAGLKPEYFVGRVVHFENGLRRTAHTISSAARHGHEIVLTSSDDLLVGRARIDAADDSGLATKTALPLAPIYRGASMFTAQFQEAGRVLEVSDGKIALASTASKEHLPAAGADVWLVNVGRGDRFELPLIEDVDHHSSN